RSKRDWSSDVCSSDLVLVIGASGDIGISICKKLANQGFQLILHYNTNKASVKEMREELPEHAILMEIQADLRDEYNVEKLLKTRSEERRVGKDGRARV